MDEEYFILYTKGPGGARYVCSDPERGAPSFTPDPRGARRFTRRECRRIDQSVPYFMEEERYTPAMIEMLAQEYEKTKGSAKTVHFARPKTSKYAEVTACGNHRPGDSVTSHPLQVTCTSCLRRL